MRSCVAWSPDFPFSGQVGFVAFPSSIPFGLGLLSVLSLLCRAEYHTPRRGILQYLFVQIAAGPRSPGRGAACVTSLACRILSVVPVSGGLPAGRQVLISTQRLRGSENDNGKHLFCNDNRESRETEDDETSGRPLFLCRLWSSFSRRNKKSLCLCRSLNL